MFNKMIMVLSFLLIIPIADARKARCSDFSTQAEAQAYMLRYGAYYLDRDRDGEACECLPGGSKYGTSVCRRR
ncbi:excalibur calcium-binding domain-containing protein [Volucribacter amazonae]|nr:excalibur calcium-binding domain-containing protein [Volucribacter amazonae]